MKLLFSGDTALFQHKSPKIDPNLKSKFLEADFRICNLEGPILPNNKFSQLPKKGPSLCLNLSTLDFLKELNFTHLSIANNHIMDYGMRGLEETLSLTRKYISFGAGISHQTAYAPVFFKKEDLTVGSFAVAENGFGCAVAGKGGFAVYDNPDFKKMITALKKKVDFIVLVFHAGAEEIPYPLPEWKEIYRRFCDLGVDIIVGHHPHVPQGIEKYKNSIIVYSLGNFYFEYENHMSSSYSIIFELNRGQGIQYQIVPHIYHTGELCFMNEIDMEKLNSYIYAEESVIDQIAVKIMNSVYIKYYRDIALSQGTVKLFYEIFCRKFFKMYKKREMFPAERLWLFHNLCIDTHYFLQKRALKVLCGGNDYVS